MPSLALKHTFSELISKITLGYCVFLRFFFVFNLVFVLDAFTLKYLLKDSRRFIRDPKKSVESSHFFHYISMGTQAFLHIFHL